MSDVCNESGCVALGTEFAHDALAWLLPVSLVSVFAVRAGDGALRALRGRLRRHTPKTNPVSRTALVGLFVGICALALLLGVLRGVMINEYGR